MKKIIRLYLIGLFFTTIFFTPFQVKAETLSERLSGRILLQVEKNGEAWYVDPATKTRVYLGRPDDAFAIMRQFGIGITNDNLNRIAVADSDSNLSSDYARLHAGKIFLQVQEHGEAWYVNPVNLRRYYLGRPADAFNIMRNLGLGITNSNLNLIMINGAPVSNVSDVLINMPFAAQAPFGEWDDARHQDGCEEASAMLAMRWVRKQSITNEEASAEIKAIADWELERYGSYVDTSAKDTVGRIFNGYYKYYNVEVKYDISVEDIKNELKKVNLVIVPVNGRLLGNPHFTAPGPIVHMLIIKGYDNDAQEFIANEIGTRQGESYRYSYETMYNAINDYPTGDHLPRTENVKAMIVVRK